MPRGRRWVRLGVSAAALAALLRFVPVRELMKALTHVSVDVLVSALVVLLIGHAVAAAKWRLLQGGNTGLSLALALRAHFCGVMANLWLPGVVGGDLVRAGMILSRTKRPTLVVLASLVDRIVDSLALLCLAGIGLALVGDSSPNARHLLMAGAGVTTVFALLVLGGYRYVKARPVKPKFTQLMEAIDLMVQQPGRVGCAFLISIAVQTAFIIVNVNLGRAVGMAAPISAWFLAWPLAKIAALVPISAAGLGIREAALVVLMRPFGDPSSAVMAAGLLWQAVFIFGGILGSCVFFLVPGGGRAAEIPAPSSGG